ncbi:MAG: hypothetical protein GF370_03770, partial [Candidatus Nealsonbacteria bacterium]|nr:hypothetical protein [Candidatus Nealsonbacteria bacterium]
MSTKDIPVFLALMVIGVAFALYQCEQTKLSYLTPSQIVENFYSEWIAYSGEPPARSPITDRIYRNSEYVTDNLINKLDETIASFEQGGAYDPVLCAQDKPRSFSVKESTIEQQSAEVIVEENFGESVREIQVHLI